MNRKTISTVLALVALVLALTSLLMKPAAAARQDAPRWEYKVESIPSEKKLNDLGAQGWELVAVESNDRAGRNFYFKRAR